MAGLGRSLSLNTGPSGSLFGGGAQPSKLVPQPGGGGLFGSVNNASTAGAAQQTVPGVKIDASNIKLTTRFSELHEDIQNAIVFIDDLIQSSIKASMQCSEAMPNLGRRIESLPSDVEYLDSRLETAEGALGRDALDVEANKRLVEADSEDAVRLFRAIENLKLPEHFRYSTIGGSFSTSDGETDGLTTDLLGYFDKRAVELEAQAARFSRHQNEVNMHLKTVEQSAVEQIQKLLQRRPDDAGDAGEWTREVAAVMRTFEDAILRVAEKVGEGREKVVDLSLSSGL